MRWIGYALAAVVATIGILILCALTIDLGRFKGSIQTLASDLLGRELAMDTLSLRVGRSIRLRAEGVRLASTRWTPMPHLIIADEVEFTLDTLALLDEIVLFDAIRASGLRVHAVVDPHEGNNFTFPLLEEEPVSTEDEAGYLLVIREARINDMVAVLSMPDLDVELAAPRIQVDQEDDGKLGLEIDGTLNDTALSLTGHAGPLENMLAGSNVGFDISGNVGEVTVHTAGTIDDLADPRQPEFEFAVHGPNAEYVTSILGTDPITTGPFDFDGGLAREGERMRGLIRGTYGEFQLTADVVLSDLQSLTQLEIAVEASGPNVATVAALTGNRGFPDVPFSVHAEGIRADERVTIERARASVGDASLDLTGQLPNFPGVAGAQATVSAHVPNLDQYYRLLGLATPLPGAFDLTGTLMQGADGSTALDLSVISSHLLGGVKGTLSADPSLIGSTLTVRAEGPDLATVGKALGVDDGIPPRPFAVESSVAVAASGLGLEDGRASLGNDRVTFNGFVANDPMAPETQLTVTARLPTPAATLGDFGIDDPGMPPGPLAIDGGVGRTDDGFTLRNVRARMEGVTAGANGRTNDAFDEWDVRLEASGPNVRLLTPEVPEELLAALPFETSARVRLHKDQLQVSDAEARIGPALAEGELEATLSRSAISARVEASAPAFAQLVPRASEFMEADDGLDLKAEFEWRDGVLRLTDGIRVRAGQSALRASGTLDGPPDFANTRLRAEVHMPSLAGLNIFIEPPLPDETLDLKAVLTGTSDTLMLSDLLIAVGASKITGSASLRSGEVPYIDIDLSSDYLDVEPWSVTLAGLASEDTGPAPGPSAPARVIADVPLPGRLLVGVDGELDLAIRAAHLPYHDLQDIEVRTTLLDNELNVRRLALTGNRGTLGATGRLIRKDQVVSLAVTIDGRELTLGLPADSEEDLATLPRYTVDAELNAGGSTTAELARSLNGNFRLVGGEGQVALGALDVLMRDFAGQVVSAINPFARSDPFTQVQCVAVLLSANDGIVVGRPAFVLQTDKVSVTGVIRVDMSTERLRAVFTTQARRGLGISLSDLVNPYTEVGGTLASPTLQLNSSGALVEGGVAVATAGLSIIARQATQRFFAARNPCARAIRRADAAREQP